MQSKFPISRTLRILLHRNIKNKFLRYGKANDSECSMNCSDGSACGDTWKNSVYYVLSNSLSLFFELD